jgi:paraquat-inducible protein B
VKRANPQLIGAFIIGALVLTIVAIVVFGAGDFFAEKTKYVIFFRGSVDGLSVGAPVKIRGVRVGTVRSIAGLFDENGEFFVEVIVEANYELFRGVGTVQVSSDPETMMPELVRRGLRAQLALESFVLWQLFVRIDYFPGTPAHYMGFNPKYVEIPSVPTTTEELEVKVKAAINTIAGLPLEGIGQDLRRTLSTIDSLVRSPQLYELITALGEAARTSDQFMRSTETQMAALTAQTETVANALDSTLAHARMLMGDVDVAAEDQRIQLATLIEELTGAARAIRSLADRIERNPESLLKGK